MGTRGLIEVTALARCCKAEHVPLDEAVARARLVLGSADELGRLCLDAHDRIRELEGEVKALMEARGNVTGRKSDVKSPRPTVGA